ncbi:MAG: AAA family ATPase [Solobacterium sp.]|nr:AAA family ATPase [Solobacterium sp.]
MEIRKIVITGGPCAGKTTAMSWIQNEFSKLGYTVLFVPETATELISGGVAPWTCGTNMDYQRGQLALQREKERVFEQAARTMDTEKVLIVCDRGMVDNRAYMTEEEFRTILSDMGLHEVEVRDEYDAIFHLVTAAKGAESYYSDETNAARYESTEEAIALDDRLIAAWTGHPHLRVIDNSTDFETKLKRLVGEIYSFLGEQMPYEIERKFLIEYPDIAWLESIPNARKVEIIQTYLNAPEGEELRVRQRGERGYYTYWMTAKRQVSDMKRVEVEERLTQNQYLDLLMEADNSRRPIRKTRYCMTYDNQYFEIDIYPFWDSQAIMEIELPHEDAEIRFPEGIHLIREVTSDPAYKNAALAKINVG